MAATEKVGIEIELMNADEAYKTLRNIDETVRNLGRKKTMIKLDDGSIDSIDNQIKKIQDRLDALRAAKKIGVITPEETEEAKRLEAQLRLIKRGLKDGTAEARSFKQEFNSISSKVAHVGSALQSFGNAMTTLTSPFRRVTDGILMGTGYKLLNSFTEGFEKGFTRYDTMKKYPKIMAAFGYSAEEAQTSIDALDKSVRGLPTGLDEMVDLAQRFTATTGDIDKGTKLAIAANNAFLASMSTDTQKYQGMMQLQDVLGGKDMNAREWNSLVSSMTPAIVKMGESLGYTSKNMDEWIQKVRDGKVDNEDFINTLIKIGNEGGVLEAMARESKDTWQAFFANVGNAASRMMAKIITSMDEVVKALGLTDKDGNAIDSVNLLLSNKLIPTIDDMAVRVQKWIKAHPEEITNFFKDLKSIDWGGLVRGYVKGMGLMLKVTERFFKLFDGKGLGLVGGFLGAGGGIGKAATIIGGLLKGTRHLWALLGVGGKWLGGKLGKIGIFGRIASIFGSKKSIVDAGQAAKSIPTVTQTLRSAFNSLSGLIKLGGGVLIAGGTAWFASTAVKGILNDLKDISKIIDSGDINWESAAKAMGGFGVFVTAFASTAYVLGDISKATGGTGGLTTLKTTAIIGAISSLILGFADLDTWLIKTSLVNIRDSVKLFDEIRKALTSMKGLGDLDVGDKLNSSVQAVRDIITAFTGENGGPSSQGRYSQGIPTFTRGYVTSLTNLSDALAKMQTIVKGFNAVANLTVKDPSKVIADIKAACDQLQGIRGPKGIVKHTTAVANALKQIKTMADRINNLAVQQIKDALDELKGLSQTMKLDIKVVLGDGFRTSVNGVVKQINTGKSDIDKAVRKIPSAITKHISVTITASVNTRQAVDAITRGASYVEAIARQNRHRTINDAKGGLIYRAKGGGVPWKRRGTDTVPAMLTPGEYVHNKRAVSTFGIDFMRKVNNLDVKGAMNELMHRAGNMANVNRGAVVTNNYNNQRVTINNNGNPGAGFTFKSASRFVGAI